MHVLLCIPSISTAMCCCAWEHSTAFWHIIQVATLCTLGNVSTPDAGFGEEMGGNGGGGGPFPLNCVFPQPHSRR